MRTRALFGVSARARLLRGVREKFLPGSHSMMTAAVLQTRTLSDTTGPAVSDIWAMPSADFPSEFAAVDTAATVVAAGRGLLMLRSPYCELRTGTIVDLGNKNRQACVLFVQHGHYFATLLGGSEGGVDDADGSAFVGHSCEATGDVLCLDLPQPETLVGRTIDCFARSTDGGSEYGTEATAVPLFASQPSGSQRGLIVDNLATGWLAIDALTPIGRGQSMMLVGPRGTGKTSIAVGCVETANAICEPQINCIYACMDTAHNNSQSSSRALPALGDLASKATIVTPRVAAVFSAPVERYLMANAAVAVGELWRDRGADALVIIDEINAFHELWVAAATLAQAHDPSLRYENGKHEIMEMRPYRHSQPDTLLSRRPALMPPLLHLCDSQTCLPHTDCAEWVQVLLSPTSTVG
eukprot:COSAG05_NODE_1866_length_3934_cov_1.989048_2_plen_411_part_00